VHELSSFPSAAMASDEDAQGSDDEEQAPNDRSNRFFSHRDRLPIARTSILAVVADCARRAQYAALVQG